MELIPLQPKRTIPSLKTITAKYLIDHNNNIPSIKRSNHPCIHMDELLTHPDICEDLQDSLKEQFITKYGIYGMHKGVNTTEVYKKRVEKSVIGNNNNVYFIANDKTIFEMDTTTNNIIGNIQGHEYPIRDLIKNKDILISGSFDNTIKLWNPNTYECLQTLDNKGAIGSLTSENTDIICTISKDKIKIWDISTGKCLNQQQINGRDNNTCILHNGILYAYSNYYKLIRYDLRTKSIASLNEMKNISGGLACHNLSLFSGSYEMKGIKEWDLRNLNEPIKIFNKNKSTNTIKIHNKILFVALSAPFSFGGGQGFKLLDHPGIEIWDLKDYKNLGTIPGNGHIFDIATDNSGVYVSSTDNLIKHTANSYNNTFEDLQNIDFTTTNIGNPVTSEEFSSNNRDCSIS
jgi:WD40 repeat protein